MPLIDITRSASERMALGLIQLSDAIEKRFAIVCNGSYVQSDVWKYVCAAEFHIYVFVVYMCVYILYHH